MQGNCTKVSLVNSYSRWNRISDISLTFNVVFIIRVQWNQGMHDADKMSHIWKDDPLTDTFGTNNTPMNRQSVWLGLLGTRHNDPTLTPKNFKEWIK